MPCSMYVFRLKTPDRARTLSTSTLLSRKRKRSLMMMIIFIIHQLAVAIARHRAFLCSVLFLLLVGPLLDLPCWPFFFLFAHGRSI